MEHEITIDYRGKELDVRYWWQPDEQYSTGVRESVEEISEIHCDSISVIGKYNNQLEEIAGEVHQAIIDRRA